MISILLIIILLIGIGLGYFVVPSDWLSSIDGVANVALHLMIVCVGVSLGRQKDILKKLKTLGTSVLTVPFGTILGSLLGGIFASMIVGMSIIDGLAIGGGMGYYSLTGTFLYQLRGVEIGMIGFLSNFLRETVTFLVVPFIVRLSPTAAISIGGATTMDMTLPLYKRYTNSHYTLIAFVHGVILSFIVPILLNFWAIF